MYIQVQYKRVWGKERFYPISNDAKFLASVIGKPTILKWQLKICFENGHKVDILQEEIDTKNFLGLDEQELSGMDMPSMCLESIGIEESELPNFHLPP
jgi:hypothetical protein